MDESQDRIVGSAEPLDKEQTRVRLRELAAWGVDLSLVQASLEKTPTERVQRMIQLLDLTRALRSAYLARAPRSRSRPDPKP